MAKRKHIENQPWATEPDAATDSDMRRLTASVLTTAIEAYIDGKATVDQLQLLEDTEQFTLLVNASHHRAARHQAIIATERTYKQLFPNPA